MIAYPSCIPPPYKSTPGGIYIFFFDRHLISGGKLDTTPPSDVRLKTYQTPKYNTRWTPFTHNTHAPVSIPLPAWRQLLRPIAGGRSSLRPGHTGTCCCRASSEDHVVFSGSSPPTGTGPGNLARVWSHSLVIEDTATTPPRY